ncbi:MFS transporter [Domibacillus sp. DTU_2020_1001157_1_SI_ALB_TIR_016]|uniref:MFS transporter n=1 Tax=Domibacillus sp. DTU_2020_1001157_1_SI_ALB_TIR_016 TaxID=3077789 RepID=UPI0028E76003|nr:MFS transporter [Domibacillus sp. DTU_2020_1001157_1_SI_ALB_TIR_016]WNS78556.1 MFS transporter [Domibacillus sp. DTU_2020_1001157_1_SI_ALB_TIR_016]
MKKWKRPDQYLVFICTSIFMSSIAGSRPLVPLYANDLGASHAEIGVIVALFSFLPLFLSIKSGKIIDRIGIKIPIAVSILFGSASMILLSVFTNILGLYVSQVFSGLSQLIFVLAIQAYAGQFLKRKLREHYITLLSIGIAFGSFIGPLIGGFLSDIYSYTYAFLLLGAILFLLLPASFLFKKEKSFLDKPKMQTENSFNLVRISNLRKAIMVSSVILLARETYTAFFPLLAADKGISNAAIGVIIALNAGAGILIHNILPWLSHLFKRNLVMTVSIIISGLIYLFHPLTDNVIGLSLLSFILGFFTGIGQPLSIFMTIESLPSIRMAEGLGLRLMFNKLTQIIGPLSLGAISSSLGMSGVFYLCGALIMVGSMSTHQKKTDRAATSINQSNSKQ